MHHLRHDELPVMFEPWLILLDQNWISVVKRVRERCRSLIVWIRDQPRRRNVAFTLIERRYETLRISYYDAPNRIQVFVSESR